MICKGCVCPIFIYSKCLELKRKRKNRKSFTCCSLCYRTRIHILWKCKLPPYSSLAQFKEGWRESSKQYSIEFMSSYVYSKNRINQYYEDISIFQCYRYYEMMKILIDITWQHTEYMSISSFHSRTTTRLDVSMKLFSI